MSAENRGLEAEGERGRGSRVAANSGNKMMGINEYYCGGGER